MFIMDIRETQLQEVTDMFSAHLNTISIILGGVALIFTIVAIFGGVLVFRWSKLLEKIVDVEVKKYIASDDFKSLVEMLMKDKISSLDVKKASEDKEETEEV